MCRRPFFFFFFLETGEADIFSLLQEHILTMDGKITRNQSDENYINYTNSLAIAFVSKK